MAAGTASLLETTVVNNTARGGQGGNGKVGNAPDGFTLNAFTVANTASQRNYCRIIRTTGQRCLPTRRGFVSKSRERRRNLC